MAKLIIFDFDGTIADTLPMALRIINELGAKHSIKVSYSDMRNIGTEGLLRKYTVPFWEIPVLLIVMRNKVKEGMKRARIFRGIAKIVKELSKSHKLAIATSNSEDNVKKFLKKNGLGSHFDKIFSGISLFGKERTLKTAVEYFKISNKETVFVGDEIRDVKAAKKCKMKVIAVSWGYNSKKLLSKGNPDFIVKKPEELLKIAGKI